VVNIEQGNPYQDNMIRRNWAGDPACYFCDKEETITHLLFQCSIAKAVWAIVAHSIGATDIPSSFDNCWEWCNKWLPSQVLLTIVGNGATNGCLLARKFML
jgi:hypothetical protein